MCSMLILTESTSMAEASTASTSSVSVTVDAGKSTGDNGMPKSNVFCLNVYTLVYIYLLFIYYPCFPILHIKHLTAVTYHYKVQLCTLT